MKTVLHISRNLPPLVGGMERLNAHVVMELACEYEVLVVGPAGAGEFLPDDVLVSEVEHRPLWKFLLRVLVSGCRIGFSHKPSMIFAGSGLMAPIAWLLAKIFRAKTVVYVHGLDLIVSNKLYRFLWLPFIRHCDLCLANSKNTEKLARSVGVSPDRIRVLNPGVELPKNTLTDLGGFLQKYGVVDKQVLLSVGRITPRKGLLQFVENCLPRLVDLYPNIVLIVIGGEAEDALVGDSAGLAGKIMKSAENRGLGNRLIFAGNCDEATLVSAYQSADLHVFPVRNIPGDVEGFGMVAIEAAAHGLPTIAFDVGGVADAVNEDNGYLISEGDYLEFTQAVSNALSGEASFNKDSCRRHAQLFAWPVFGENLNNIMRTLH